MASAAKPKSLTIRTYHVGFGDCFLLSFSYGGKSQRHVLIDYGSTGLPPGTPKSRMMDIAKDIEKRTGGKLDAVVATHRHKDHISGFETKARGKGAGKGTGDIIRSLSPKLVVQPWTEDPNLRPNAPGPSIGSNGKTVSKAKAFLAADTDHVARLSSMQTVAEYTMTQTRRTRYFGSQLRKQFYFLGESNINNPSAVKNLMTMAKKNVYVYAGKKSGLEGILPGVKVDVLGPPTVRQTATIKKQRSKDPDEFWHFQAAAMRHAEDAARDKTPLFPEHVRSHGPVFPVNSRWLIYHARNIRGSQLLQIVRMLDKAMNNTSIILLFRIGKTSLLFPGDAQIENWQYALSDRDNLKLLSSVNVYKVGHHGSLNATPKTLWQGFKNRSKDRNEKRRLLSLMSTMEHKHGSEESHTEVPRTALVSALKTQSTLFSTQELTGEAFYHETTLKF